jgi:hypothetical protein
MHILMRIREAAEQPWSPQNVIHFRDLKWGTYEGELAARERRDDPPGRPVRIQEGRDPDVAVKQGAEPHGVWPSPRRGHG